MLNLFSSLGGIFHPSLPGESAERVVKSRKHPELTLPVLRYCNLSPQLIMLFGTDEIFSICLFSLKNNEKKYLWMSSAAVVIGALRVKSSPRSFFSRLVVTMTLELTSFYFSSV